MNWSDVLVSVSFLGHVGPVILIEITFLLQHIYVKIVESIVGRLNQSFDYHPSILSITCSNQLIELNSK